MAERGTFCPVTVFDAINQGDSLRGLDGTSAHILRRCDPGYDEACRFNHNIPPAPDR